MDIENILNSDVEKLISKKSKLFGFAKRILILTVVCVFAVSCGQASENVSSESNQSKAENQNIKPLSKKIDKINKYQQSYFEVVYRNDVLLKISDSEELYTDRKDLDNLFSEVEKQITNERYLNKYKRIQKRYSNCDAITTIGINNCAEQNYNEINNFLDKVYKKSKSKASSKERKELILSQDKWAREVRDYKNTYDSMGFGTIGTSIYYSYEINMREFRTLLLMLYL